MSAELHNDNGKWMCTLPNLLLWRRQSWVSHIPHHHDPCSVFAPKKDFSSDRTRGTLVQNCAIFFLLHLTEPEEDLSSVHNLCSVFAAKKDSHLTEPEEHLYKTAPAWEVAHYCTCQDQVTAMSHNASSQKLNQNSEVLNLGFCGPLAPGYLVHVGPAKRSGPSARTHVTYLSPAVFVDG